MSLSDRNHGRRDPIAIVDAVILSWRISNFAAVCDHDSVADCPLYRVAAAKFLRAGSKLER